MPKYNVEYSYTETHYDSVEVEADSEDEAGDLAFSEVWDIDEVTDVWLIEDEV
jgi:hypothetical protein